MKSRKQGRSTNQVEETPLSLSLAVSIFLPTVKSSLKHRVDLAHEPVDEEMESFRWNAYPRRCDEPRGL